MIYLDKYTIIRLEPFSEMRQKCHVHKQPKLIIFYIRTFETKLSLG